MEDRARKEWKRGMENPNRVKRSIRLPKEMNKKLERISYERGISINKVIIEIIKEKIG